MNPNLPLNHYGADEAEELCLQEQAGLVDGGLDEDGQQEWIGTDKDWDNYERLSQEHIDNCTGCALCEQ